MAAEVLRYASREPVFELVGRPSARGVTWAWARGDLDMAAVPAAHAELAGLLAAADEPGCVLVYLGDECFVDLCGLRLLDDVAALLRLRGDELVVAAPPRCLRTMIALTGVGAALPLADSVLHAGVWVRNRDVAFRPRRRSAARPASMRWFGHR
jgi:anti-anti-sigma factor